MYWLYWWLHISFVHIAVSSHFIKVKNSIFNFYNCHPYVRASLLRIHIPTHNPTTSTCIAPYNNNIKQQQIKTTFSTANANAPINAAESWLTARTTTTTKTTTTLTKSTMLWLKYTYTCISNIYLSPILTIAICDKCDSVVKQYFFFFK